MDLAHQIYQNGLTPGKSGNISSKIFYDDDINGKPNSNKSSSPDDFRVLITPSGVSLKDVSLKNVIMVDLEGNQLNGEGIPSSELYMHLEIYKRRDNVRGIVHTHSPYATGFSFSNKKIPRLEGFGKIKDPYLKIIEYAPPGSSALVESASQGLEKEDVLILKNHGVLAVGLDLDEAALLAEFTESSAKTGFVASLLNRRIN